MKILPVLLLLAATATLSAQPTKPQILSRDAHSRTLFWEEEVTWPDGRVTREPHRMVEMATGLHYTDEQGQMQETREFIEAFPGGAIARYGPHRAIFSPTLKVAGAIDLEAPDGKRLRTTPAFVAYTDVASGQSVMVAEFVNSTGEILPPNAVVYRKCLDSIDAILRLSYTKAGLEQDLIFLQQLPTVADAGLIADAANVRVELFTEVFEAPKSAVRKTVLRSETRPQVRQAMAMPDVLDSTIDFGVMQIGSGQAFPLTGNRHEPVVVAKSLEVIDGRTFLIESVDLSSLQPMLQDLPQAAVPAGQKVARPQLQPRNQMAALLPGPIQPAAETKPMLMASAPLPERAVVLDYQALNGSLTNYVFLGDWTYLISGPVYLYGASNKMGGGSVIKVARNVNPAIEVKGTLTFETDRYRPVVVTARDDSTVGEGTASGSLSGVYAAKALVFDYNTSGSLATVTNVRVLYAASALTFKGGIGHDVRHLQTVNCGTVIDAQSASFGLRNALCWNATNVLIGSGTATGVCEHVTIDTATNLASGVTAAFTNCLATAVVNTTGLSGGAGNYTSASSSGVYQTVGGGYHYLTTNSPCRDAGVTNIDATLAKELRLRSTYPPMVLGRITYDTVLSPQAGRDTDIPDVGYHPAPLDFWVCGMTISSNATLLLTNGVAVGMDYSSNSWAFLLSPGKILSVGGAIDINYIVRAHTVQEKSGGNPGTRACFYDGGASSRTNSLRLRFTEFDQLANDGYMLYTGQKFDSLEWTHSRVYNPALVIDTAGTGTLVVGATNTYWERGAVLFGASTTGSGVTAHCRNNLWRGVSLHFIAGNTNWTLRDDFFDSLYYLGDHSSRITASHWGHYNTATNNFITGGGNVIQVSSLNYDRGALGRYYLPANSTQFGAGSRTADLAQLFHFTTTTNQVKETNSTVDIGLHYVAVTNIAGIWIPIDTDGDGVPDYIEDANGNGVVDSGETDGRSALRVRILQPSDNAKLP